MNGSTNPDAYNVWLYCTMLPVDNSRHMYSRHLDALALRNEYLLARIDRQDWDSNPDLERFYDLLFETDPSVGYQMYVTSWIQNRFGEKYEIPKIWRRKFKVPAQQVEPVQSTNAAE